MKNNQAIIELALTGEKGAKEGIVLYWDNQDPKRVGPAYRTVSDSGGLCVTGWAHSSGPVDKIYNIADFFAGADGLYNGPIDGIYPTMETI